MTTVIFRFFMRDESRLYDLSYGMDSHTFAQGLWLKGNNPQLPPGLASASLSPNGLYIAFVMTNGTIVTKEIDGGYRDIASYVNVSLEKGSAKQLRSLF